MDGYSFDSLICNGREVLLADILNKSEPAHTPFEASAFSFIQRWAAGDGSFIQNTSGSTGAPKPIVIRRDQMVASARLTQQALSLKSGDVALVCLDPEYIAGKMMLARSFVSDLKIIAADPSSNPFHALADSLSIDFTALVPMQLYEIIKSKEAWRLNSLKKIIIGGAALNGETQNALSKFEAQIYATYGMTETVSHVALQALNGAFASDFFTTLPTIRIGLDARGCLIIEAPYLDGKITTNDLVELKDDRQFKWLGRVDNIINTGGVKVIPEKIESLINTIFARHGLENKFFVTGVPDPTLGYKIALFIEGAVSDALLNKIPSYLKENLLPYEVPKKIYTRINFILTKNGKINRSETLRQVGN